MLEIGLTGGIATGKSTVAKMLVEKGATLYKADDFGHQCLQIPSPTYFKIVAEFGTHILEPGSRWGIDRKKLAEIVFNDESALSRLNAIIHPAVKQMHRDAVAFEEFRNPNCTVVYECAVLFDYQLENQFDVVIATHCRPEQQIERALGRKALGDRSVIERCVQIQMPFEEYRDKCWSIDTSDWNTVPAQVEAIWSKCLALPPRDRR